MIEALNKLHELHIFIISNIVYYIVFLPWHSLVKPQSRVMTGTHCTQYLNDDEAK